MTLDDLDPYLTIRAWNALVAYMHGRTDIALPLGLEEDELLGLHGVGPAVARQVRAAIRAYTLVQRSHPLYTDP